MTEWPKGRMEWNMKAFPGGNLKGEEDKKRLDKKRLAIHSMYLCELLL
jgi:hypothetical protein